MSTLVVTRIEPLSLGKFLAAVYGGMGALTGVFTAITFVIMALVGDEEDAVAGMLCLGPAMVVGMPLFYAALGFCFGALGAVIFNWVARSSSGLELQVRGELSPPAP